MRMYICIYVRMYVHGTLQTHAYGLHFDTVLLRLPSRTPYDESETDMNDTLTNESTNV